MIEFMTLTIVGHVLVGPNLCQTDFLSDIKFTHLHTNAKRMEHSKTRVLECSHPPNTQSYR